GETVEQGRQRARQRFEIFLVAHPVGQRHVERRARLADRKVLLCVDRIGGDLGPSRRERSGAVALMDVAIDDQDAVTLLRQPGRGDGQIVEHAEARAGIGQGMVAATRGVGRIAVLQREPGGQIGAAGYGLGPTRDFGGDGEADAAFLLGRDRGVQH
ncbi:hypothetical protein QT23_00235, partial [Staphylococcus aureus]